MALILDQSQNAAGVNGSNFFVTAWVGQTFTPSVTAKVGRIILLRLRKSGSGMGNCIMSIRNTSGGLPTGADLVSTTVAEAAITTSFAAHNFEFPKATSAILTASTVYAFCLRAASGDANNFYQVEYSDSPASGWLNDATNGESWTTGACADKYEEYYWSAEATDKMFLLFS